MGHYGIGALTSVTILAELGDVRRFSSSREAVRYAGMDITVHASDKRRAPGSSPSKARPRCAGRCTRPPKPPAASARRTATTSCKPPSGSDATAPAWRSHASCSNAHTTPSKTSARRDSRPHELPSCAHAFSSSRCTAASSRHSAAATPAWTASKDRAAALPFPHAGTPSPSCRRPAANPRSWTEISMGARAHTNADSARPGARQALRARPCGPPSG